jgi:acyl transferase domain-containing protein/NAD(P)-dependent dehydrogenase (short-subunit alcohol dehydrogenase family)/acyl carrier protein
VGHTEGTAGIAGILRASLALQHGIIPPNLHFRSMNPKIAARAPHLRVPTTTQAWPGLHKGVPRRASINSFGFGGTNVHVVMESFQHPVTSNCLGFDDKEATGVPVFTPFTFSGISQGALITTLEAYLEYLRGEGNLVSLRDLAWTLQYKRSLFEFRCSIAARSHAELVDRLYERITGMKAEQALDSTKTTNSSIRGTTRSPQILAVFPGQGAQYVGMGKQIIEASPFARSIIDKLDESLATLPAEDRPMWKLKDELVIEETRSHLDEAEVSQSSTTAIQILLVYLLKAAGIKLKAVVGHSSGEIGAAFAAGLLTADDAIRNAYYRGLHASRAGSDGKQGAMLAAAVSEEEAAALCNLPNFKGRIMVAANSSTSKVTFSGDLYAIDELEVRLHGDGIAVKRLSVKTAYHSHHMLPCTTPYESSLKKVTSTILASNTDSPAWFSSVYPGAQKTSLSPQYWSENMARPVLFREAISAAVKEACVPDVVLEVGAGPVLERAIRQNIAEIDDRNIVHSGLLNRNSDAVSAFSGALGLIWSHYGRDAVDMESFDRTVTGGTQPRLVKNLPTYRWQYDKEYWWHSRYLRKQLQSKTPPTELLGSKVHLSASHEAKWRQFLDPKQSPWMLEHKIDGSFVLPASAYVTMVAVAIQSKYLDHGILSIDLQVLRLQQPIAFASEHTNVELVLTLYQLEESSHCVTGSFTIDFCTDQANEDLTTASRGRVSVIFGEDKDRSYPELLGHPQELVDVKPDIFYHHAANQGLHYQGSFRNIISAQRKMNFAKGQIALNPSELIIHPAVLDGLFQGTNIANSFPGDSALPDIVVPSLIRRVTVFPQRCKEIFGHTGTVEFLAVSNGNKEASGMLHCAGVGVAVQFDGLKLSPYRLTTVEDDVKMYSEVVWEPANPNWHPRVDSESIWTSDSSKEDCNSPIDSLFSAVDSSDSRSRSSSTSPKIKESLMILGGTTSLSKKLESSLSTVFQHVVRVPLLENIDERTDVTYAILSLVELKEPVFLNMTRDKWQALQRLFSEATDVLWVTSGIKSPKSIEAVYANVTVGLTRCIRHELRHLRLQIIDIDEPPSATVEFLADAMIRWHNTEISPTIRSYPELSYEGGATYALVIHRLSTMNDRYNSQHRKITRKAAPATEVVELVQSKSKLDSLHVVSRLEHSNEQENFTRFRILNCTQLAFKIKGLGFLHLGIGRTADNELSLVVLEKNCSLARVRNDWTFTCKLSSLPEMRLLEMVVADVVARTVINLSSSYGNTVLICSDATWSSCIKTKAEECGRHLVVITGMYKSGWEGPTYISKHSLAVAICEKIPADTSTIINLSNRPDDTELFLRAKEVLQDRSITFKDTDSIFRSRALLKFESSSAIQEALALLKRIALEAPSSKIPGESSSRTHTKRQANSTLAETNQPASVIVDWSQSTVQVPVRPSTDAIRFTANKAYLLVGSSEIARSICEWMARCGAKYFVIVSRNTNTVATWASDMLSKGIFIKLHSADITNEASINSLMSTIKQSDVDTGGSLPRLGGLIHLATVFHDGAFTNMSYDAFKAVANTKAKGSLLLHNAFSNEPLDFFILTSSLSYIIGNPGQANYNAGNAFMASLARYRRSIGLSASVVHLGTVAGIGHMAKQGLLNERVGAGAYPISERDLHQIFAEAVLASPVDSGFNPEIITGLKDVESNAGLPFVKEPMFRNIVQDGSADIRPAPGVETTKLSLREKLATTIRSTSPPSEVEDAAFEIVRTAFVEKLKSLLQVGHVDDAKSVVDLGIDSLAVIEVDSWVKSELRVKVQRSVFFGGSVRDVVGTVVKSLDKGWIVKT